MSYYQEGYDAYDHTKGLASSLVCPYAKGTYSRTAWLQGFKACRYLCVSNAINNSVSSYPLRAV